MRLVAVADTHLFVEDLVVPEGDVLIHAGDLCRHGDLDELAEAAAWLRALPHRHKIVVAGNHDWAFQRTPGEARAALGPQVIYLEDEERTVEGVRFYGSPWQPAFHDWAFNLPRGAALAARWRLIPSGLDVLVTHSPPAGIGDGSSVGPVRLGCVDLLSRLGEVAPALHFFGHIHEGGGAWDRGATLHVNCTTWECERAATVVDYDPATRRAQLVSVPPPGR